MKSIFLEKASTSTTIHLKTVDNSDAILMSFYNSHSLYSFIGTWDDNELTLPQMLSSVFPGTKAFVDDGVTQKFIDIPKK